MKIQQALRTFLPAIAIAALAGAVATPASADPGSPSSLRATPGSLGARGSLSGLVTGSGQASAATLTMIRNRARVLGDKPSGSGTRYFAVTDADLAGKRSPKAVLRRLVPSAVKAVDGVRKVEVLVELRGPLTLSVAAGQEARIGTVTVDPDVRRIEVRSNVIISSPLTILPRK